MGSIPISTERVPVENMVLGAFTKFGKANIIRPHGTTTQLPLGGLSLNLKFGIF